MLEQLVNNIIEGPLKKSCKTSLQLMQNYMQRKFFCYQISNFYSFVNSMRNNKDLIKSVLPCLSTASLKDPLHEKPCKIMKNYVFSNSYLVQCIQRYNFVSIINLQQGGYLEGQMWSNFRTPQPTNHTLYFIFKKELRPAEIGIWKENPHGNTIELQWA